MRSTLQPLFLSLSRKIPQTAAEGRPLPPPWGSCSPCSCCFSTPAPAGTLYPRPPAFSTLQPPPPALFSFKLHLHSSSLAQWSGSNVPFTASGTPAMPPCSPLPAAIEELGCGQGPPGRAGTESVPRRRALPAAQTWNVALAPSARDVPSTSPVFLA